MDLIARKKVKKALKGLNDITKQLNRSFQNYLINAGIVQEDFSDSNAFTTLSNCTVEADVTNGGMKVTALTSAAFHAQRAVNWYFPKDDEVFEFNFYCNDTTTWTTIIIYLANSDFTKYFTAYAYNYKCHTGKNTLRFCKADFTANSGAVWTDAIKYLRIRFTVASNQTPNLTVMSIKTSVKTIPKVIFSFDDGMTGIINYAKPIMDKYGYKGSCACVHDYAEGTHPSYMRTIDLTTLYNAGWDIMSHGYTGTTLTTLSTDSDRLAEITNNRSWLLSCGFNRSADFFVPPGSGGYNDNIATLIKNLGFICAVRTALLDLQTTPLTRPEYLKAWFHSDINTTLAAIDRAKSTGSTIILYMHNVVNGTAGVNEISTTDLDIICAKVMSSEIDVVTFSEWYNGLNL